MHAAKDSMQALIWLVASKMTAQRLHMYVDKDHRLYTLRSAGGRPAKLAWTHMNSCAMQLHNKHTGHCSEPLGGLGGGVGEPKCLLSSCKEVQWLGSCCQDLMHPPNKVLQGTLC